jgi:GTPase SAR1 family protein
MDVLIQSKYLKFRHPFTCLVSGPTGSGKTILVRRILKNFKQTLNLNNVNKLKVIWCYGQFQELYKEKISDIVEVNYFDYLLNQEEISKLKPDIIVIDDLMTELGKSSELSNLFTRGSHHLNISIFFIVQNIFHQGKEMRNINLNSQYIILMKSFRNKSQIKYLEYQLFGEKTKLFEKIYADATKQPFGYLVIDLKPDTPDEYRLRTRLTEEELPPSLRRKTKFSPYYYNSRR